MKIVNKLVGGIQTLSELVIDTAKDWGGYRIENVGAPTANGHAFRRGDSHAYLGGVTSDQHHAKTADNEVYGLVQAGLAANRPAAAVAGRWYFSTDTLVLERDNGTAWVEMARGETALRLAQLSEKSHASLTSVTSDQHHAQAHTLASHSTKAHSELTGIGASDHHAKTTSFADITDRAGVTKLAFTANKLLKGAGAGVNPTEIDAPTVLNYEARVPSDTLRHSNDTQRQTGNTTWTKIKEILLNGDLEGVRVKFDSHAYDNYCDNYFAIYKNGSLIGSIWHRESATWYTSSEDFSGFAAGDKIQIYAYSQQGATDPSQAKNMRLYYDWHSAPTITHISGPELVTPLSIVQSTADPTISVTIQDP